MDQKLLQVPTFMRRERVRISKRRITATALDRKLAKTRTRTIRTRTVKVRPVIVRVQKLAKPTKVKSRELSVAAKVKRQALRVVKKPKIKPAKKIVSKILQKPVLKKPAPKSVVAKKIEKPIAEITHFFDKIKVAVLKVYSPIEEGDVIRIVGTAGDFKQAVKSMQINHETVQIAKKGADVGLKLSKPAKVGDKVYLV